MKEKNNDARLLRYVAMYTRCTRDIDTTCYSFKNRGAHGTRVKLANKQIIRLPLQSHQSHDRLQHRWQESTNWQNSKASTNFAGVLCDNSESFRPFGHKFASLRFLASLLVEINFLTVPSVTKNGQDKQVAGGNVLLHSNYHYVKIISRLS